MKSYRGFKEGQTSGGDLCGGLLVNKQAAIEFAFPLWALFPTACPSIVSQFSMSHHF
jgi:hypothetical protein